MEEKMTYMDRVASKFFKDLGRPLIPVFIIIGGLLAAALGSIIVALIYLIFGIESHWIHVFAWGGLALTGLWKILNH